MRIAGIPQSSKELISAQLLTCTSRLGAGIDCNAILKFSAYPTGDTESLPQCAD